LALLPERPAVLAFGSGSPRAVPHPLGRGRIERHVAPVRPLQPLRQQGRHVAASELEGFGDRSVAVPADRLEARVHRLPMSGH
jgi:hypothetical protein